MINKIKVIYLTSSHYVNDDRIFFHIKDTLERKNFKVDVCSTYGDKNFNLKDTYWIKGDELSRRERVSWFCEQLILLSPEMIICGEPLPILAAKKFQEQYPSCKIIYDVTEWYPSKKNLYDLNFISKTTKFFTMFVFNLYAASLVDGFIVGEYYKKKIYDFLFPLKPKEIISYYPKRKYVSLKGKKLLSKIFRVGYSGKFSEEKGINRVFKVAESLRVNNPDLKVVLVLVGKTFLKQERIGFRNLIEKYPSLNVEINEMVPFEDFSKAILSFDVALDLRDNDIENTRCLPIKVFHYNACGIPVVYSNLKALKKGYVQADFCELVEPNDTEKVATKLQRFIDDPIFYADVSNKAVTKIEKGYLWEHIEGKLLGFIQKVNN
ncbi:hypothetical protein AXE80_12410 [Wenyingzhuangia fucanilytica]|uniref:Glycosyl transferase family 1 domain-containing protein n=1 Tax=Wenyingzhuangia fucanilytica TaxID=1790137 RepID=A0A1B1Y8E3_9FLAO|nr:glycosyltransferase [Wenyingzhuangia fucanilytica]ANW97037.1 hypothetical protein AXE80_12410 [Wenyingzhuangia fucanilytica]